MSTNMRHVMLLKSTATTVNEVSGQVRKVKYLLVKLEK